MQNKIIKHNKIIINKTQIKIFKPLLTEYYEKSIKMIRYFFIKNTQFLSIYRIFVTFTCVNFFNQEEGQQIVHNSKIRLLTKYKLGSNNLEISKLTSMTLFQIRSKITLTNSGVTKLIQNPYDSSELISATFSGQLCLWKLPNLKDCRKISLKLSKITSIVPFQNSNIRGFLLAVKNGQLLIVNQKFEIFTIIKNHSQSISDIIVSSKHIITIGMDGKVIFLSKNSFEKERIIQFEYPLFSGVEFENRVYLSSIKSFAINLETFEWTQGKRFDKFFVLQNNLYGCSEERGLSSVLQNSNNYIPAQFLLAYNRKMMIFSQKSICVANLIKKLQYKAKKYEQFSTGESITTGVVCENNIYVGGNEGNIYWITQCLEKEQRSPAFN